MRILITLICATAAALIAGAAWACSCVNWRSASDQLGFADVAFVGRAVSTRPDLTPGREGFVVTEFAVSRTLKGTHRPVQRIAHAPGEFGATCGVDFVESQDSLVLANRQRGTLSTSACARPRFPLGDFERAAARG